MERPRQAYRLRRSDCVLTDEARSIFLSLVGASPQMQTSASIDQCVDAFSTLKTMALTIKYQQHEYQNIIPDPRTAMETLGSDEASLEVLQKLDQSLHLEHQ